MKLSPGHKEIANLRNLASRNKSSKIFVHCPLPARLMPIVAIVETKQILLLRERQRHISLCIDNFSKHMSMFLQVDLQLASTHCTSVLAQHENPMLVPWLARPMPNLLDLMTNDAFDWMPRVSTATKFGNESKTSCVRRG